MKIKGLTHKMKNRIRELGDEWEICQESPAAGEISITPVSHVDKPEPYMRWVKVGVDIEIVVEKPQALKGKAQS